MSAFGAKQMKSQKFVRKRTKAELARAKAWAKMHSAVFKHTNEIDHVAVQARIRKVASGKARLSKAVAHDVAFHMTDALYELEAYHRFCADPSGLSDAEVNYLLTQFLIH